MVRGQLSSFFHLHIPQFSSLPLYLSSHTHKIHSTLSIISFIVYILFHSSLHLNHTDHKKLFTQTLIYTYPINSSTHIQLHLLLIFFSFYSLYSTQILILYTQISHTHRSPPSPTSPIHPILISSTLLISYILIIL